MLIGQRLRELREAKKLSQGDVEHRTGMLRCYISRVENGYTTPSIDTLERWAHALETPLYFLFHDGDRPAEKLRLSQTRNGHRTLWGEAPKERRELKLFVTSLSRMTDRNRNLLLFVAQRLGADPGKFAK